MGEFKVFSFPFWLLLMQCFYCCNAFNGILKGLPFNLPHTRFCNPCEKIYSRFYYPSGKQDEFCLRYTNDVQNPQSRVYFQLIQLLQSMNSIKSPYSFVVHAYIESMRAYQAIYKMPYDISVLAFPTVEDTSCIKIFKSGVGFLRQNITRDQIRKIYPTKFIDLTNGRKWESIFLNGMEDIWASAFCNRKNHARYYRSSVKRVRQMSDQSRYWMFRPVGPYDNLNPAVNPIFFRECGDNTTLPKNLADDAKRCVGQLECTLNPILPEHAYAQPQAVQLPNIYRSAEDTGTLTRSLEAKKQKLDVPTIVINEFNPLKNDPYQLEEFIEIRVHPPPVHRQEYFKAMKIVAIGVYSLRLLMVINLNQVPVPPSGYFALRSTSVEDKPFIHVSSDQQQFRLVPGYEKEPVALLLLNILPSITATEWGKVKLKPQRVKPGDSKKESHSRDLSISGEASTWEVIRQTVIDAQLYGKNLNQPLPQQLISVLPSSYSGCNFIIPIGDVANPHDMEASLNLCNPTNVEPFQFQFFKLGVFTIGSENDCERRVEFQVERSEHRDQIDIDTVGVTNSPTNEDQCPVENNLIGLLHTQILAEIDVIKRKYNDKYLTELYPLDTFKTNTWHEILIQDDINLDAIPNLFPFELLRDDSFDPNTEDGTVRSKHFRCKVCSQRNDECPGALTHSQKRSQMHTKAPIPTNFAELKRKFFRHLDSQQHLTSVLYYIQKDRIRLSADYGERVLTAASPEMRQLANVMDVTFTFLHTNTAPFNAKVWYETLIKIGASVGSSLHSKETAYHIVDFIAAEASSVLTQYLVTKDHPFTLILDGSSDSRNHHYVIVYLQALEGEVTMPYFLFLLKLETSFDATNYRNALVKAVEAKGDSFIAYFKRRIVAVATDSASVMHLFQDKLSRYVDRRDQNNEKINIVAIYCLAHKLQLSSRNAIVPLKSDKDVPSDSLLFYFSYIEKFMQSSYTWFKWSGKRIGLFRDLIAEEDLPKVEFKELHVERWISSEYRTVKNFATAWKTARLALDRMLVDNKKENKFREEITAHELKFRDKTALITVHFLWDFTAAFKVWSEYLQKMAGLLIDQFKYFEQLNDNIAEMLAFSSPILLSFLDKCVCDGKKGCTLDDYENANKVLYNGMEFESVNKEAPMFRLAASELLRKVKEQLIKYIPWDLLTTIHKLHPSQFPASKELLDIQYPFQEYPGDGSNRVYAEDEITQLAGLLGLFNNDMVSDWQRLVNSIVSSPNWKMTRQNYDSNIFWALQLRDKNIDWTSNTRLLIRSLKTIAPGSVACETGFSIFNNVKTKARIGLSDSHVESILKILINGPKSVKEFNSYFYALRWLLRGKTLPKSTSDLPSEMCEAVTEKPSSHLQDFEVEDTSSPDLFPFEVESLGFSDVYTLTSLKKEFQGNTKDKRTQSRLRSKLM